MPDDRGHLGMGEAVAAGCVWVAVEELVGAVTVPKF